MTRRAVLCLAAGALLSCTASPARTPPRAAAPAPSAAAAPAPVLPPSGGGMWMPEQIPARAAALRQLGLTLDPALLSDPTSGVLGAIVNLSGCSASFVSEHGLIVTNHHCSIGALQYNSSPSANLIEQGFLASSRADERSSGPAMRISVTRSLRDVTESAARAIAGAADDLARKRALDAFEKDSIAACERTQPGVRCELKSFYAGLRYYLIERVELRDVRLVYAPPEGIGNFGGEVDNWRWPRHVGDFTFFRAYVGKDGRPADHHADNVPYRPPHHLKLATKPLAEGDLAIVAGYPGRTSRLELLSEVEETIVWTYPRRLRMFDEYIALIERVGARDPDVALKGTGWLRRFSNYRTKHLGELAGFERGKLLNHKITEDRAVRSRIPDVLARLDAAVAERRKTREPDTALATEILLPRLLWAATQIVRVAEERTRPDAERDPDYQERRLVDMRAELAQLDKRYHPKLDQAMLVLALERVLRSPREERTPALQLLAGDNPTPETIRSAVARLYAGSRLSEAEHRLQLFDRGTPAELARSSDTLIRTAVALRPLQADLEERSDRFQGKLIRDMPVYMQTLLELSGGNVAPDANGTLRVAYGTVRGPAGNGGPAFTRLSEVVAKHRNEVPFDVPDALLQAAQAGRHGPYRVAALGDVPVNFLTDVASTNGNSGSATLDATGKLSGLLFDGTFESVASDWVYLPDTRSIHVDVRYMLWVMDAVSRADWLLEELGVSVKVPR